MLIHTPWLPPRGFLFSDTASFRLKAGTPSNDILDKQAMSCTSSRPCQKWQHGII